ncbi:dihydrolipoamide acetyltransferase family protein [Aminobacter aganoensis]|uniref:Dihydrolipoamide acetyltransferase component of pyruvate dehydrogenase complex n=1 Tax=Aminobacter aganoensis TaxID=83264 RepID=A0A7X0F4U3_9HYPH|nr:MULTISPECIES: dihydrolipoamide acetyltransferase family protein [Aminobacter]KQU65867.1 branched-chain alpha-keto acid dehydrogenase subunit E2 [Aminobacter sp. DSM 101952]MBB6353065.1 2-oxoisovalerate dehydrogenase E2 component (dihydrolipoyl transacylase) [Aminobacter aganoensis]
MGISNIKVPDVGEGVAEVELIEWHVKPGDHIREDDVLAAVMTDKATVEIPSLFGGTIVSLGGEIGETLLVGSVLVTIEHEGESRVSAEPSSEKAPPVPLATASEPKPASAERDENPPVSAARPLQSSVPPPAGTASAPRPEGQPPLASPAVRARARKAGIDIRQMRGSGPAGRIVNADLDAVFASSTADAAGAVPRSGRGRRQGSETIRIIGLRRKIADRMALANARIPHITVVEEVDVTALEELRATMNATRGARPKLTMLPFMAAACCRALVDHPEMNAHFDDDAGIVTRHNPVHIGIATMTDSGLVVPVLRHAEAYGPYATAGEIGRLAEAARTGKATRDELTGSTITISSLGPLGAIATTPIINHPEVAILGVNKMAVRPMWDGSQFVPRKMMNISASFDHRVIDGWDAARFVQRIKQLLEAPALIFMEDEA